ncbi:MAG: hypothetical protein NT169_17545 [Chloroflexi bacterium]|nr:hypothetical protein [Chloroflexota bacterium]
MRKQHLAALTCFVFFLGFYGLTSRTQLQVSDEVAVFATSVSLATQGDLAIDELQWLQDGVNIGQTGRDGHLYAKYFPGQTFSAAAIYKIAARPNDAPYFRKGKLLAPSDVAARVAMKLNAVWGALAMAGLLLLLARFFSLRTATATVLLVGCCTDWWYQSRGFLSEVGAGALIIFCLYFALSDRPYLSGLALGLSLLFRPTNLIALPIWLYAVWRGGRKALPSAVPVVLGGATLAVYNLARFGSPFDFGYAAEGFGSSVLLGLYGVLFSPGRSLFLYSPVLLLALPGAVLWRRKDRRVPALCLLTIGAYVLAIATWHSWDGGWTWGSRLLTPVLPLIGILLAPVIETAWANWRVLLVTLVLAVAGGAIQMCALLRDPVQVMFENVEWGNVPYDDTLYSVRYSWLALQLRGLRQWNLCDVDALAVRALFKGCN